MSQYMHDAVYNNAQAVAEYLAPLRKKGKTVVTTNGCFDILHAGHILYLADAAALGDILVAGVNSDDVVKRLKGSGRPVQNETDRVSLIAALKMVDCAFIFPENDPRAFLEIIKPDIHVKGGDYTEDIIEKPVVEAYGGKVHIVSFKDGCSTSSIIDRIISGIL